MKIVFAVALVACQSGGSAPIANRSDQVAAAHVPFRPCPLGTGTIEHELFASCAPAPYNEPIAPCPRGPCPKPCRVDLVGGGFQRIEYDARGRFVAARGNENRLTDLECKYAGGRIASCEILDDGRPLIGERVFRSPDGRISGVSSGEEMDGMHPHYIWSAGRVVKIESTMHAGEYTYDGDRMTVLDDINMDEHDVTTFTYDAAGDIATSSKAGAYIYDARKRLIQFGDVRLAWDDRDRLVSSTIGKTSYGYMYECPP